MTMLLLQTFLLLLAAYLLGALTACLVKRAFATVPAEGETAGASRHAGAPAPKPEPAVAAKQGGGDNDRFGRALSGALEAGSAAPGERTSPVVEVQPVAQRPVQAAAAVAAEQQSGSNAAASASAAAAAAAAAAAGAAVAAASAAAAARQEPAPPPPPAAVQAIRKVEVKAEPREEGAALAKAAETAVPAQAAALASAPLPADDLTRIRAIDAALQARLKTLGVRRFAEIAGWTASDVNRMSQSLGFVGRIEQENWIEQAHILARGGETEYSRRAARRQTASHGAGDAALTLSHDAVAASIAAATAAAHKIGAGAHVETAPRPVRLGEAIREQSAKSAAAAAGAGGEAELPRAPVIEPRADYSHLRSVRSEALRSEPLPGSSLVGSYDDLKRVRGIGVLLEKKLNSLGIATYEQIANWTGADVERFSQHIEPRGRIERENWIEQARILASGGQTDYARRFDRGEVEMGG
jgi:predicted flap endonuclease-1-like 5' DNA nuclease